MNDKPPDINKRMKDDENNYYEKVDSANKKKKSSVTYSPMKFNFFPGKQLNSIFSFGIIKNNPSTTSNENNNANTSTKNSEKINPNNFIPNSSFTSNNFIPNPSIPSEINSNNDYNSPMELEEGYSADDDTILNTSNADNNANASIRNASEDQINFIPSPSIPSEINSNNNNNLPKNENPSTTSNENNNANASTQNSEKKNPNPKENIKLKLNKSVFEHPFISIIEKNELEIIEHLQTVSNNIGLKTNWIKNFEEVSNCILKQIETENTFNQDNARNDFINKFVNNKEEIEIKLVQGLKMTVHQFRMIMLRNFIKHRKSQSCVNDDLKVFHQVFSGSEHNIPKSFKEIEKSLNPSKQKNFINFFICECGNCCAAATKKCSRCNASRRQFTKSNDRIYYRSLALHIAKLHANSPLFTTQMKYPFNNDIRHEKDWVSGIKADELSSNSTASSATSATTKFHKKIWKFD